MNTIRLVLGVLLSLLALALMNASSNDYRTLFAIATALGLLGMVSLEGPVRGETGGAAWAARALMGFAAAVTAYGGVALVSMLISKGAGRDVSSGVGVTYPGSEDPVSSPNDLLAVINRDDATRTPSHVLSVLRQGDAKGAEIFSYSRSVQVAWASDSRWLMITDHRESDETTCVLLDVESGKAVDVLARMRESDAGFPWLANHHVYVSCRAWLGGGEALVEVTGYGERDSGGFERRYRVDLQSERIEEVR